MAQISDVMHASAVFHAARQELAWAYSGDFTDVPEPMKGAVHTISEVLNEAEMRWVKSTTETKDPMAAVVATGDGDEKKREDVVGVVKEVDTRSIGEAEKKLKRWLERLEEVACDMRAVARKELLGDYSRIDDKLSARWLVPCLPITRRAVKIAPTIDTVAPELEKLKKQYGEFGYSSGIPLAATCTEQPACSSAAGGQEERETSVAGDVPVETDDYVNQMIIDMMKRCPSDVRRQAVWFSLPFCAFVLPKGEGHGVVPRDLLNQWCSLGITARECGESCISDLLVSDRSLLRGEWPTRWYGEMGFGPKTLRMEDLVHDFARYLLGDRLIVVDGKNGAKPSTSSPLNNKSSSAYLALVRNFDDKQLDMSSVLPPGILALRFEGCGEMELRDGAFASFGKYLRLLDLSGYSENKMLPDFIRHLKQLRYLKAPGIQDQEFPSSIISLHELRYLILHGSCQLKDLIQSFERLSNLLHLDLSGCSGLKALPDSFGRLWRLEHLDLSACSGIEALPESFGRLQNLSYLDLTGCSRLQALPMFSLLRELRYLNLSGCSGLQKLPDTPVPSKLKLLDLSGCSSVCYRDKSKSYYLEMLVHLDLSGCKSLIEMPWGVSRRLRHLDLSYCSQLTAMPHHSALESLLYLDLSGCKQIGEGELPFLVSGLVERVRGKGGRASGPKDASLRLQGTSGTTN